MRLRHSFIFSLFLLLATEPSFIQCTISKAGNAWRKRLLHVTGGSIVHTVADADQQDTEVPITPIDEPSKRVQRSLQSTTGSTRMPSLFMKPEEYYLDKYAACLAATEGLRKLRDSVTSSYSRSSNPLNAVMGLFSDGSERSKYDSRYRQACAEFVVNSSKVIRALGLTVAQFNQIGREVSSDPVLKEKVSLVTFSSFINAI